MAVWLFSAVAGLSVRSRFDNAGGDHFDTKPVRFEQLRGRIESLLPKAVIE